VVNSFEKRIIMRKPRRIQPGDTIGIASPSSPVKQIELEANIALLHEHGYRTVAGDSVLATVSCNDYLAGTDSQRAADIDRMFADDSIDAIFCARGGYGATRLLNLLDWDIIRANPKVFTGYSDITSLHTAIARHAEFATYYSPNVATLAGLDAASTDSFWQMVEGMALTDFVFAADPNTMQTLVPGLVRGRLAGGCLSLLAHACGSQYAPDFTDCIVLIEDVGESIYRADRTLIQLRNAGLLDTAAGFVVGTITRWQAHEADPPQNSPDALWQDILAPLGKPTITGFPFGHEPNPLTLPLGCHAELDATARTLTLLESPTS